MRIILYLLSLIYGIIISIRNFFFDYKILNSKKISVPTICIGNLSLGGSGKTPLTDYIAKLLSVNYNIAILSRGYGRKLKGFQYVECNSNPCDLGDEPLQLKKNNSNCVVAVNNNRLHAIKKILADYPKIDVVLLDDGFQHRRVKFGLNIIVTTYQKLYIFDKLFPLGNLREHKQGAKRADIIIVSKTPEHLKQNQKEHTLKNLNISTTQTAYFSSIKYYKYRCISKNTELKNEEEYSITLVTGIANSDLLKSYLRKAGRKVNSIKYKDHHSYSKIDIDKILLAFNKDKSLKKLILTTEKDAAKIQQFRKILKDIKIYFIPIEVVIFKKERFEKQILDYVRKN